jgi:hypothetical protein
MNARIISAFAGLTLFAGVGSVAAQDVVILPEQETVIREYVQKKPLASIALPGVELNLGSTMPDTVELHEMEVPDVKYRYVVIDGRTYLVEPETRRVVHVLQ